MKKLLSFMLVLAMLLSVVHMQVMALDNGDHVTIAGNATTVEIDGTTWKVVRTLADMPKAQEADGRYILAGDIDCTGIEAGLDTIVLGNGAILDGNGYALLNLHLGNDTKNGKDGIFGINQTANTSFTVRNLTFGTPEAPTTISNGLAGRNNDTVTTQTTWENVTVHCVQARDGGNPGAFFSTVKGNHSFKDCNVYTYDTALSQKSSNFGGYISGTNGNGVKLSWENCNAYGNAHRTNNASGFISYVSHENVELTFKNCNNYMNIHMEAGNGAGGFVSVINKTSTTATFENCNNYGVLKIEWTIDTDGLPSNNVPSLKSRASTAGFVAENTGTGVYKNCRNYGAMYNKNETGAIAGGIEGFGTHASLENCFNAAPILVATNISGYAGGLTGSTVETVVYKNCVNVGALTVNGKASDDPENPFPYMAGNLAGRANQWSAKDCIAAGFMTGQNATRGVLFGQNGPCQDIVGENLSDDELMTQYETFGNKYIYVDGYNLGGVSHADRLTNEKAIELLNALNEQEQYIVGDNGSPVIATPALGALQAGANDASLLRLIGTIDTLVFNKAGFSYTVTYEGEEAPAVTKTVFVSKALGAVDGTENGVKQSTTADLLGGVYAYTYVIEGLRTDVEATITVTPLCISGASTFEGETVTFVYNNGTIVLD